MLNYLDAKLEMLDNYIEALNNVVQNNDVKEAKRLQREIIGVYESEIDSLKVNLDNYNSIAHWNSNSPVDFIGDAKLLAAKLLNYKLNLASGLYKQFKDGDGVVSVTQHVNQEMANSVTVSFEQTIKTINELPSSELSDEDKEILLGKLTSISAEKNREQRWKLVGSALKWIADKGIDVGIAALPYLLNILEAGV